MAPHVATNPHEEAARLRKAYKLADCAMAHDLPLDLLQQAGDDFWATCADQAGCNKPSATTIDLVISIIRRRTEDPSSGDGSGSPARAVATPPAEDVFAEAGGEGEPETDYTETGYDPFEGLDASPSPWSGLG